MLLEAEAGLEHRRVGERSIELEDAAVGAVVEAAVDADRPVDAVHHADALPCKPTQARRVEVERVEEARSRLTRDAIRLDREAAPLELARQSANELVTPTGRRRQVLVEDREVGVAAP